MKTVDVIYSEGPDGGNRVGVDVMHYMERRGSRADVDGDDQLRTPALLSTKISNFISELYKLTFELWSVNTNFFQPQSAWSFL